MLNGQVRQKYKMHSQGIRTTPLELPPHPPAFDK